MAWPYGVYFTVELAKGVCSETLLNRDAPAGVERSSTTCYTSVSGFHLGRASV
jgi:hypothetical protein